MAIGRARTAAGDAGDRLSRHQVARCGGVVCGHFARASGRRASSRARTSRSSTASQRIKWIGCRSWRLISRAEGSSCRVAVLVNPADARRTEVTLRDLEPAARTMGVRIQVLNANTANEIDAAFESISRELPDALFVAPTLFLNIRLVQLAQLAAFHRLPSTHDVREYAEVGGLMSYGSNIADTYRQVGVYAGRILRGSKTAGPAGRAIVEV